MKNNRKMAHAIDAELKDMRVSDDLRRRILESRDKRAELIEFPTRRRPRMSALVAAACAAVMLLAVTAVAAANRWGVLDFFSNSVEPLVAADGAETFVQADLGEARNADIAVTLRELVFDGKGIRYALDAEPVREGTWLYSDWTDFSEAELARPGRVELPASFAELICPDYEGHVVDVEPTENGLTFYEEGWIEGDFADSLSGSVRLGDLEVPFTVQAAPSQVYCLTPRRASDFVDILDVTLTHTLMADYLRVTCRAKPAADESGFVPDEDATYYTLDNATFFHADSRCGGMENARAVTGAQLKDTGKRPCPLCLAQAGAKAPDFWHFTLLDESGAPLNSTGGAGVPEGETTVYTEILQRTEPRAEWTLRLMNWSEWAEDIPCDACQVS